MFNVPWRRHRSCASYWSRTAFSQGGVSLRACATAGAKSGRDLAHHFLLYRGPVLALGDGNAKVFYRFFEALFSNFGRKGGAYGTSEACFKKCVRRGAHTKKKKYFLEQHFVVNGVFELAT